MDWLRQLKSGVLLLCFALTLPADFSWGQSVAPAFSLGPIQVLSQELPNDSVYAVVQGPKGFLWVGTQDGLARYDGYRFVVFRYDPGNPDSLSHDDVVSLAQGHGGLWVGTWGGGLNHFDPDSGSFWRLAGDPGREGPLPATHIHRLFVDPEGGLWVGTRKNGLFYLAPELPPTGFVHLSADSQKEEIHGQIWTITGAAEGVWIGCDRGVYHLRAPGDEWVKLVPQQAPQSWQEPRVIALLAEDDQTLWIGTDRGLFRYEGGSGEIRAMDPDGGQRTKVNSLFLDQRDVLWVGLDGGGLSRYDPRGFFENVRSGAGSGLPHNQVQSLFEDRANLLWIGTRGGGLARIDRKPRKFTTYHSQSKPLALPNGQTRAILVDSRDNIWVGTSTGLVYVDRLNSSVSHFTHQPSDATSLSANQVTSLAMTGGGTLWVGTERGLNQQTDEGFKRWFSSPEVPGAGIRDIWITSLVSDGPDRLWAGTREGLLRIDEDQTHWFRPEPGRQDSLGDDIVSSLLLDEQDVLWVGFQWRGLDRLLPDSNRFEHFTHDPNLVGSLANNTVFHLHEFLGFIWVATDGGGLNRFNRESGRFQRFTSQDGLPSNTIYAIADDGETLWLSTAGGLVRFLPESSVSRVYDLSDGLQDTRFLPSAVHRSQQNELFFGGNTGVSAFFPRLVQDNPYPPDVAVAQVRIPGLGVIPHLGGQPLILSRSFPVFELDLAALDFTMPAKNRYRFRLEPYDKDWRTHEGETRATYVGVPSGDYIFRVQGSNNDGLWSREEAQLEIKVLRPWYFSWWAYLVYTLVGLLFGRKSFQLLMAERERLKLGSTERMARKRREETNESKRDFLASVSHEMRTPLTSIVGYAQLIGEDIKSSNLGSHGREILEDLAKIKSAAYQQLALVTNIIELGKLETGPEPLVLSTFDVGEEIKASLAELTIQFEESHNQFDLELVEPLGTMRADRTKILAAIRNFLIFANGRLHNGHIQLTVRKRNTQPGTGGDSRVWTTIAIKDDGPVMPREVLRLFESGDGDHRHTHRTSGSALGLELANHYVQRMGGIISVDSIEGGGTVVVIQVPDQVKEIGKNAGQGSGK